MPPKNPAPPAATGAKPRRPKEVETLLRYCHEAQLPSIREFFEQNPNFDVDMHLDRYGNTALMWIVEKGNVELVKFLLDSRNARPNVRSYHGETAIHKAAFHGNVELCRMLHSHGADVNVEDKGGNTALHYAALQGHTHACDLLIQAGARVFVVNKEGLSPLDMCPSDELRDHPARAGGDENGAMTPGGGAGGKMMQEEKSCMAKLADGECCVM